MEKKNKKIETTNERSELYAMLLKQLLHHNATVIDSIFLKKRN